MAEWGSSFSRGPVPGHIGIGSKAFQSHPQFLPARRAAKIGAEIGRGNGNQLAAARLVLSTSTAINAGNPADTFTDNSGLPSVTKWFVATIAKTMPFGSR